MIQTLWHRIQLMIAQGRVTLVGSDNIQAKVQDGEVLDNLNRVEPYGFSSHPKRDSQAYLAFPAGDRSHGICLIIGDKRYQMGLQEGEVALHDDEGNHVLLKRGGVIEVAANTKVIAQTPLFQTSGDARIGGNLTVIGTTHLSQLTTCDAPVLAAGFAGAAGAPALMPTGMTVTGAALANGKEIGALHTHTTTTGQPTSGVN